MVIDLGCPRHIRNWIASGQHLSITPHRSILIGSTGLWDCFIRRYPNLNYCWHLALNDWFSKAGPLGILIAYLFVCELLYLFFRTLLLNYVQRRYGEPSSRRPSSRSLRLCSYCMMTSLCEVRTIGIWFYFYWYSSRCPHTYHTRKALWDWSRDMSIPR